MSPSTISECEGDGIGEPGLVAGASAAHRRGAAHDQGIYADREELSVAALCYWRKVFKAETMRALDTPEGAPTGFRGQFVVLTVTDPRVCDVQPPTPHVGCLLTLPSGLLLETTALPAAQWLARLSAELMRGSR